MFIPWLSITPLDTERMPFILRHRQFPVRHAFAMTINKAQG
jgi:ATP-dependent exoDNAse (exonuclease V) alpha subunit